MKAVTRLFRVHPFIGLLYLSRLNKDIPPQ
jgi:hypothetical protein